MERYFCVCIKRKNATIFSVNRIEYISKATDFMMNDGIFDVDRYYYVPLGIGVGDNDWVKVYFKFVPFHRNWVP